MHSLSSRVLLVSHYTKTPGMYHKINDYLVRSGCKTVSFLHPLYPRSKIKSVLKVGTQQQEEVKLPYFLQYLLEGFLNLFFYYRTSQQRFDYAVCFDPLSFFYTYSFRKALKVERVLYYNIDFSLQRFENKVLDLIYHAVNKIAYQQSHLFLTPSRMFSKVLDPNQQFTHKQHIVRHSVPDHKTGRKKKLRNSIIFAGTISKTVNFTPFIAAVRKVQRKIPDLIITIYGDGTKKNELKRIIENEKLSGIISLRRSISNAELLAEVLPKYQVAVAPYAAPGDPTAPDHMFLGNDLTSKVVEYLHAGCAVVSTPIYEAFDVIEKRKLGFLATTVDEWEQALYKLLKDDKTIKTYQANARAFAHKTYSEANILYPIFSRLENRK